MDGDIDQNQEMPQKTELNKIDKKQIGTMEAWSLLQDIQDNLDSIDVEIHDMRKSQDSVMDEQKRSRDRQLRSLKAKKS